MPSSDNQYFEIEIQNTRRLVAIAAIVLLAVSTLFYFQKTQSLQDENADALRQVDQLNETVNEQRTTIREQNETIQFERERNDEIKQENGELRATARQALVEADFMARQSTSGSTNVDIDFSNYGNTTAENVQATCNVYREGADERYGSFTAEINTLENRTIRTVSTSPVLSEEVRSTDKVSCEATSCEGDCKLLEQNIDRPYSDYLRVDFN